MTAATAFLDGLDAADRDAVLFARGDRRQQQRWSNLPAQFYERRSLRVGDLDQPRVDAFLAVMRATLSSEGFQRVTAVWAGDDALAATADRGTTYGRQNYWIAIIGEPSTVEPWQ